MTANNAHLSKSSTATATTTMIVPAATQSMRFSVPPASAIPDSLLLVFIITISAHMLLMHPCSHSFLFKDMPSDEHDKSSEQSQILLPGSHSSTAKATELLLLAPCALDTLTEISYKPAPLG